MIFNVMKKTRIISLVAFFYFALCFEGRSQDVETGCLEKLSASENEFTAGRFYGIPSILKECIDNNGFTNEQLVRAYLLLTQVYLLIDDPIGAEQSYLKMLRADPEYVATEEKDPVDVYFLSKKFTTTPIFTPHFKAGLLETVPAIIRDNNTFGNRSTLTRSIAPKVGWTIGSGIEWNITDNWGIGGELFLSYKSFGINYRGAFGNDQLNTTEKQYWFDLPLYARYADSYGKFRPFVYVGHSLNFLVNSAMEFAYTDFRTDGQVSVEGPDINIGYNRKFFNRALLVGAGLKIKTGKNFLIADVRYTAGLTNISKGSYYDSGDKNDFILFSGASRYAATSNDLRVDNLVLTIGYVRPLYDPRKIKKPRTKGVSRKMSESKGEGNEKN